MFLFGLIAVSVARGQGILLNPVVPEGISVNDASSQNACDNGHYEAQQLSQDFNTGNIGVGTCSWQANLTVQSFGGAFNTAEIVEQSDIYGSFSPTTTNLLLIHTFTQPGLGFAGLTPPAVDQPLLVVNAPLQSVGIGMHTPLAMLHINNINAGNPAPPSTGTIPIGRSSGPGSTIFGSSGTLTPALWVQNTTGGTTTDALYVGANGNVGIDNESPQAALDVTGNALFENNVAVSGNSTTAGQMAIGTATLPSTYASLVVENTQFAIDLVNTTPNTYNNAIRFFDGSYNLRQLIYDDGATGNLVIYPGWGKGSGYGSGVLNVNGKVQIGNVPVTSTTATTLGTDYMLYVQKGVIAEKYKCAMSNDATNWSDYVFDKDYKLASLNEVEKYIKDNHHLPDVPSTDDVHCDGIDLAQMDATLLKKVEELTLYVLELKKEIATIKSQK